MNKDISHTSIEALSLLSEHGVNGQFGEEREVARNKLVAMIYKITDLKELIKITESGARRAAAIAGNKISEQIINGEITDQMILVEIAKSGRHFRPRVSAIKKITDEKVLIELIRQDKDLQICIAAAEGITDHKILIELTNYRCFNIQSDAIRKVIALIEYNKITDKKLLIGLATHHANEDIRTEAGLKICKQIKNDEITDQITLVELAKNSGNTAIQECAINKISNNKLLVEIAKNDQNAYIRATAYNKFGNNIFHFSCKKAKQDCDGTYSSITKLARIRDLLNDKDILSYHGKLIMKVTDSCEKSTYMRYSKEIGYIDSKVHTKYRQFIAVQIINKKNKTLFSKRYSGKKLQEEEAISSTNCADIDGNEIFFAITKPLKRNIKESLMKKYHICSESEYERF